MNEYRNFADSIFSSEIWDNEGRIWLTVSAVIVLIAAIIFMFSLSYRSKTMAKASLLLAGPVALVALSVAICDPYLTRDFNRLVAEKNVEAKYDASKIDFLQYDEDKRILTANYADKETQQRHEVSFTFEKGDTEPFLLKRHSDDEVFSNIEKALLKAE